MEEKQQPNIPEVFLKPYNPAEHEKNIYKMWEDSGFFDPDVCIEKGVTKAGAEPFSIVMPPPNANASLHAGHALFVTVEDIMIRFERMRGKKTLWFPGSDHAGFETQAVYEKHLQKQKRSRFDMTNEELRSEIWDFVQENKAIMEDQVRSLGASCDWNRELFTLDERVIKIVHDTFKQLEDDELLYRGKRTVNWCPKHQTSFSNLEIEHEKRTSKFYYFQYGPFVIGTSRPETKFGDKYVVMHPNDARYAEYNHGQKIELEWIHGSITATVIKDEASDPEMGSGVMTITPWHSHIDFDIAKKHNLEFEQIIDWRGKLMTPAGEFEGMNINDAREAIVKKLDEKGLLVKIDDKYEHSVPCCYKCNKEIEPQVREQWFVKTKPLAEKAVAAVDNGEITFVTDRDERVFKHWMENIEDWPIARQIAWGIPIPAKVCTECGHGMVDLDDSIKTCTKCDGAVEQDPDTFDTWFSSGQWPLATTNFPEGSDFKEYYPTSVMETGKDIIFFWVARMIMLGIYRTGKAPFKKVYLHGMVRDKNGVKMSKSKGNVIAPQEIQDRFGTDALRMGLIVNNSPGSDMNLDPDKVNAYKKFANKIWNITRFVLDSTADHDFSAKPKFGAVDRARNDELKTVVDEVTALMEKDRFDLASEVIYHFVWDTFASEIIEESKVYINSEGEGDALHARQRLLIEHLTTSLKLLHPYMPFVTETIWQELPKELKDQDILMVAKWPKS
ncbi:MAG: valyl-tRNA synthetase [Candidatus Paceibacteria bacterium]|jgi:valyl-tRNA synthetase